MNHRLLPSPAPRRQRASDPQGRELALPPLRSPNCRLFLRRFGRVAVLLRQLFEALTLAGVLTFAGVLR